MLDRRSLQSLALNGVAAVGALAIMFSPDVLSLGHAPGEGPTTTARIIAVTASLTWASAFAVGGFRRAEEFVQERSKFAWYWGSLIGLAIGVPLLALFLWGDTSGVMPLAGAGPRAVRTAFALGALAPVVAQLAGFVAVSLWWRATKR